ncbi:MAG: SMP-30/gluconolactonase/LRE family protein, partial [Pseudomonadota bacterium]|nr:SMP-30/gluconolactonase/LRE family protein [Pseudomonadota bacterium]
MTGDVGAIQAIAAPPSQIGESPFWHPDEAALYWLDIASHALHRFDPATHDHRQWGLNSEPGCIAPLPGGQLLMARRDGLWRFDPSTARSTLLAKPPFDPKQQRFNDGKADPQGRLWVGTRDDHGRPLAALYRWDGEDLKSMRGDLVNANGLAFSPDGRTLYQSDTAAHRIDAFDFDPVEARFSAQRVFARFPLKSDGEGLPQDPANYGGRPDGAAVDAKGHYWVAMYEGQRLLQLAADGRELQSIALPVRCPTMPSFGGADLKTLYITTGR